MIRAARFVLLTFGVTWALWMPVLRAAAAAHEPSRVSPLLALGGPVFLVGVFAPGLAAVALTAREEGRHGIGVLLRRVVEWRVAPRFYAFALLLMPFTKLAVAVLHRAIASRWPPFGDTHPLVLPPFFMPGADTDGQSFPLYALQVTAYSVMLAWLYWRTGGSVLLTMFMHAAFNNMKDILPSGGVRSASPFTLDGTLVFRLTVALLWAVALLLLVRMRGGARLRRHVG